MENFELIEEYVTGRLQGQDKQAFEQQLQSNPSLQSDVLMQKQIIESVKKARISELKAMLNQVPVGGAMQAGLSAGQIAAGIVATGVIVTSALFYFKPWEKAAIEPIKVEQKVIDAPAKTETSEATTTESAVESNPASTIAKPNIAPKKPAIKTVQPIAQPKIDVVDPTEEMSSSKASEKVSVDKSQAVTTSRVAVETNDSNKKYSFHYQFNNGKLILYGAFDRGLYEILEVNGDSHSIFLFYKDSYYLLNDKQTVVTPLAAIKDQQLIRKLKEYRGR